MQNIFFSIIIPTLNEENYIENIISSLEKQTYKNFEVIIVDNGSKDRTVEIIKKIQKKSLLKIILVFCKQRGISYARNYGVKYAKGEYIVFFDADGVVSKNYLKNANNILIRNRNLKALSGIYVFWPCGNIFKFILYNSHLVIQSICQWLSKLISGRHVIIGNAMVIEKKALLKEGRLPNVIHEDMFFSLKFFETYKNRTASKICRNMIIFYSPRRFEKQGYIKTLINWLKNVKNKTNPKYYKIYR